MTEKRRIYLTAFVLLALYLSLMETLIPKPFLWMKLGLANIVTIVAIEKFDKKMAVEILILRILVQAMMLGTLFSPSFIISLISGISSTFLTIFLYKYRENLSLVAICIAGAFAHNLIQLAVVYFLFFRNISLMNRSVFIFITIFLVIGCVSGTLTGCICEKLKLRREHKII